MAFKTWQKYLIAIIPLLVLVFLFHFFGDIVCYIIMAWVVSMVGAPIYSLLNKFLGSGMSAAATLFLLLLCFVLFLRIVVPPLVTQAKQLAEIDYERMMTGLEEPMNDFEDWLGGIGLITEQDSVDNQIEEFDHGNLIHTEVVKLDSLLQNEGDSLMNTNINLLINIHQEEKFKNGDENAEESVPFLQKLRDDAFKVLDPSQIPKILGSFVGFFGGVIVALMSVLFIAFFFLKEKGLFVKMVSLLVANDKESKVSHAIEQSTRLLVRYFVGLVIQVLIITVVTTLVLKLFGFKNALLMALCFAVLNLIPYLGPIFGNLVGVLIVISSNLELDFYSMMLPKILTAIVIFGVIQILDNFILQPNIFSKSVKAHPLEIFLIVLIGAKLGGVLGMVIAIPVYTVIRVLLKVFFSEFEVVKRITATI